MTCSQLQEIKAFSAISPIDDEYRQELRHGQMMHLLDAAHFKRTTPLKPVDFMNFIEKPPEKKLTPSQIEAEFTKIFGA